MAKVVIFTEAGLGIGFGHLMRCTAISEELSDSGNRVEIILFLNQSSINVSTHRLLNWHEYSPADLIGDFEIVVIDSYRVTQIWLSDLYSLGKRVVHIDDYNRIIYPVDLIINPNLGAMEVDYSNQTAAVVGGSNYIIIRKKFRSVDFSVSNETENNLLITMGGSDIRNMLNKIAIWAAELNIYKISIIVPDGKLNLPKEIRELPLLDEEEILKEMLEANVVISACGQTLHELAILNKPVIGIGIDIDQIPNQEFYNRCGFISKKLWWNDDDLKQNIKSELIRLSLSSERSLQKEKKPILNPDGVKMVASAIINYA